MVVLETKINSLTQDALASLIKTCFPLIKTKLSYDKYEYGEELTIANIFGSRGILEMLKNRSPIKQTSISLDFKPLSDYVSSPGYLPILDNKPETFHSEEYLSYLTTEYLGRVVIHCNVITSTFDVLQGQFLSSGLAVIADVQTSGKGRSSNKWLSPKGEIIRWSSRCGREIKLKKIPVYKWRVGDKLQ